MSVNSSREQMPAEFGKHAIASVAEMRERARRHLESGAITEEYGFLSTFDTAGEFLVNGNWHHESDERRAARLGQWCPRQPVTQPNKVQGRCGHDMLQVGFC